MGDNSFATGYALGADSAENRSNNGGFGADGGWAWIWIILLFCMFGWGNNGWGNGGNGGGQMFYPFASMQGIATRADINEGFALNNITSGITAIQQGICDSTYALNNAITSGFNTANTAMLQGFNGVDRAMCNVGHQISDCCCATQNAIQSVRYDMATQACDTRNTIQTATRDIIDNQNANYRGLMDFMVQSKIDALQSENQTLKLAASQSNQNAVLMAAMDANKAEILRRSGHDCPSAAYIVQPPTPVTFPTNCCGAVNFGGGNCGGCGM